MSNEIELKLIVSPAMFNVLAQHLQQFNPLEHQRIFLGNTYYDYPDHFLAKQKMGLRIRQENQTITLTLKTDGQVVGGLHSRPEYNLPLVEKETPTNEMLRTLYPFEQLPITPLQPIFSTDFDRTFWLIPFRDSKIEVAFDQGKIVSGGHLQPICEIEFELKEGNIADLFYFVEALPILTDMYFSGASKAKRGYLLGQRVVLTDWLSKWRDFLQAEGKESTVDFQAKFNALLKMEQDLVEETLSLPSTLFSSDFMKTVERVGAFFNLYHYYDENKTLLERVVAAKNGALIEENFLEDLLESNQHFFTEIQHLIRFHSETKDNEKTIEKLTALFKDRFYFERMLKLMRLSVLNEPQIHH
ncbi:CYTH domain-containing protein [Rodentibacter myodis]|uniref:CYTH domain-containing protein n=1 Tax=Rodentibacter myodis TaxID=1907939 RepID=A0A1V3JF13_9PAST|nr:inorganic triphosphatase [Rodentibacter myodis]OOF55345.1 CYTH domain-containing protein [Rodentibacter myodis]